MIIISQEELDNLNNIVKEFKLTLSSNVNPIKDKISRNEEDDEAMRKWLDSGGTND